MTSLLPSCAWRRCAILFLTGLAAVASAAEWRVLTVDGREYVPLADVANFYGLSAPAPSGPKTFTASGGGRSLQVEVDSREALLDGVRHWLSFPTRFAGAEPCVSRLDLSRTIDPAFRPEKVGGLRAVRTVVLDAGHGGHDNGARSPYGYEKDFTLDVVRRLRKKLEAAGLKVVQTRNRDAFIDLTARPAVANRLPGAIFVSVHFNSADWKPAANGVETYAISPLGAPPSGQDTVLARDRQRESGHALEPVNFTLATIVHHALTGRLPNADRGVKRARFVVLKDAAVPAVLIEGGFLTNPAEARRVSDPKWREAYAAAIAAGILEYKKLAEQGARPKRKADW